MATSLATPADLILQYDKRRVVELASDTGTPITSGALPTDPVILYTLARASEMILMSARLGKRYTEDELVVLASGTTIGAGIRGLCCDLAFGLLVMRRGTGQNDMTRVSPAFISAQQTLQLLASGELIFPHTTDEAQIDAGTPRTTNLTTQASSPTINSSWSQQANLGLLPISPLTNEPYNYGCGC